MEGSLRLELGEYVSLGLTLRLRIVKRSVGKTPCVVRLCYGLVQRFPLFLPSPGVTTHQVRLVNELCCLSGEFFAEY